MTREGHDQWKISQNITAWNVTAASIMHCMSPADQMSKGPTKHENSERWKQKSEQWTVVKTRNGSHHSSPISSENVSLMFFPNDGSYTTLGKVVNFWKLRNFPACPPWMKTWVGQSNLPPTSKHKSESGIKSAKLFLGYLVSNMSSPWHQGMLVDHWMPNAKKLSQICNSSWSENAPSTFMWPALGLHVNCTQCTHAWSH